MQSRLGRHWISALMPLMIMVFCSVVNAEAIFSPLDGAISSHDLRPYMEYWVEDDNDISVEDLSVAGQPPDAAFTAAKDNIYSFGYTDAAHWFRWRLQVAPGAEGNWWLQISPTFLDSVDLYVPQDDGSYQKVRLGDHVPHAARPL